jgi:hypothetical protein
MDSKKELKIIKDIYWAGGRDSEDTGRQKMFSLNGLTYVASQVLLDFGYHEGEYETMVFPCNETGEVTNWLDLWAHRSKERENLEGLIHKAVEEDWHYADSVNQVD